MSQPEMMKRGIVVDGRAGQVRVRFEDNDVMSPWLDVAQPSTKGDKSYNRPKTGSMVSVVMDRNWETGTVIGAIYSEGDPSPGDSDGLFYREFGDGTVLTYNEDNSALRLNHAGGILITIADGKLLLTGDVEITGSLKISKDLEVQGQTTLNDTTINNVLQTGS